MRQTLIDGFLGFLVEEPAYIAARPYPDPLWTKDLP
jgi:hypothetical protein